jgi:hypothetical protein
MTAPTRLQRAVLRGGWLRQDSSCARGGKARRFAYSRTCTLSSNWQVTLDQRRQPAGSDRARAVGQGPYPCELAVQPQVIVVDPRTRPAVIGGAWRRGLAPTTSAV